MTALQLIGAMLLALPFVALAIYVVRDAGWGAFVFVFGLSALIIGAITMGAYLMVGP